MIVKKIQNRENKKMICEVDSLTARPPPQKKLDHRVLGTPVQSIYRSEALTVLYLCVSWLVLIGLELYHL